MRYQIFLFLRWIGRLAYRGCSWLSNRVYQVPSTIKKVSVGKYDPVTDTKPGTVLGGCELLADSYDPKRKFRWMLAIEGIPAFVVNTSSRPQLQRRAGKVELPGFFSATFYDPVVPSTSHVIWEWWKSKQKKNATLTLLDPVGIVVEEWKYTGIYPDFVDFGRLDYSSADPVTIHITGEYESVELTSDKRTP